MALSLTNARQVQMAWLKGFAQPSLRLILIQHAHIAHVIPFSPLSDLGRKRVELYADAIGIAQVRTAMAAVTFRFTSTRPQGNVETITTLFGLKKASLEFPDGLFDHPEPDEIDRSREAYCSLIREDARVIVHCGSSPTFNRAIEINGIDGEVFRELETAFLTLTDDGTFHCLQRVAPTFVGSLDL